MCRHLVQFSALGVLSSLPSQSLISFSRSLLTYFLTRDPSDWNRSFGLDDSPNAIDCMRIRRIRMCACLFLVDVYHIDSKPPKFVLPPCISTWLIHTCEMTHIHIHMCETTHTLIHTCEMTDTFIQSEWWTWLSQHHKPQSPNKHGSFTLQHTATHCNTLQHIIITENIWLILHEANPVPASQVMTPRCADVIEHYLKQIGIPRDPRGETNHPAKTLPGNHIGEPLPLDSQRAYRTVCVCYFILLNRYWGIVTVPGIRHGRAKGHAPTIEKCVALFYSSDTGESEARGFLMSEPRGTHPRLRIAVTPPRPVLPERTWGVLTLAHGLN